jgi:hypothetical protein
MPFKRVGNETHEGLNGHSYNRGDCGMVRETRAELERTS